ncbi:MAG: polysaccharide pyruvyl transferase family protein [Gemmataceae bacterium]
MIPTWQQMRRFLGIARRLPRRSARLFRNLPRFGRALLHMTRTWDDWRNTEAQGMLDLLRHIVNEGSHNRQRLDAILLEVLRTHASLHESRLMLEHVIRLPRQEQAQMELSRQLEVIEKREEGVSILISCWNHGAWVGDALRSALATLDVLPVPGEVVVFDDASTDESRQVARAWQERDPRVRVLATDRNIGAPRALNLMLRQSRHRHALLLDADNQLHPEGAAELYASATLTEALWTYGNIIVQEPNGTCLNVVGNQRLQPDIVWGNWIDTMSLVAVEPLLEVGGFETEHCNLYDWELVVRLMRLGHAMTYVPTVVGYYRKYQLSMSQEATYQTRTRQVHRRYVVNGPIPAEKVCASVHHPRLGYLWKSPAWNDLEDHAILRLPAQPAAPSRRLLVVGSGGVRNHGDDAILLGTLQRLRRVRPDWLSIVVTDGTAIPPLGTLGVWAGTCAEICRGLPIEWLHRGCQGYPGLVQQLRKHFQETSTVATHPQIDLPSCEAVLFSGGGNLASYWPDITAWRTALAAAAVAHQVPYIVTGQGIGPLNEDITRMLRLFVGRAAAFSTRDPLSAELLAEQRLPDGPARPMGDDALGMTLESPCQTRQRLAQVGVPAGRPVLGFQARMAGYIGRSWQELEATVRQVDEWAAANGYVVAAIPIETQPPMPEVEVLARLLDQGQRQAPWFLVDAGDNIQAIAGLVKACAAVVCHSYHVALFALEEHIPTVLYAANEYYQRKGEGLRRCFGLPASPCLTGTSDPHALQERLRQLTEQPWQPTVTSGDLDSWLDHALPRVGETQQRRRAA